MAAITQFQIAREAGVSRSTVAKVLVNTPGARISDEVRERVLAAAERLGYRPNRYAQVMRKGKTGLIGIINFGSTSLLVQRKVVAAAHAVVREGWHPLVYDALWFADPGEAACRHMIDSRVEGVILINPSSLFEQKYLDLLLEANIPVVANGGEHLCGIASVVSDRSWGYQTLARHLLSLGARRLTFLTSRTSSPSIEGFYRALLEDPSGEARGEVVTVPINSLVNREEPSELAPYLPGKMGMQQIVAKNRVPDALLCANDEWAFGALSTCLEADIRIPHEMAVTGFEDEPISSVGMMPLTTIAHPVREVSDRLVAILLDQLRGKDSPKPERIAVRGRLIVRRSCGAYLKFPEKFPHPQPTAIPSNPPSTLSHP
ncbi:MAG TPA: LacI family DNA-binding transcriptional regulator [Chthoniobacteraceae bacterium]|nr:LacI family DNA-binding transcriptional regulator [Chthoniobacteraceae bacterium]